MVGVAYSQTVSASGGAAPYSFAISAGALPAGLALSASTGAITGTPKAGGAASFTVEATDSNLANGPASGTEAYSIVVAAPLMRLSPASLPNPQTGIAYSQTISASGGTPPYSYKISAGALPAGLAMNTSTGLISGTPTVAGATSFSVSATDSSTGNGPFSTNGNYFVTVTTPAPAPPTVSPLSVSTACNTPVSVNLANGISGSAITGVAIASGPSHGTVQLNGETVLYTPATSYCGGVDSFSYTASNAAGTSAPGIVTISIGPAAGVAANAYVANYGDGTVSVINTGSGLVTATIPVGGQPDAVVATPDGTKAYVGNYGADQVMVVSTATNSVTKTITVGNGPYGMAISPDGSRVYVANASGRSMSVISTETDSVTNTVPIGAGNTQSAPWGLAVSPDGKTVYLADNGLSQIAIIDAASLAATGTIPTGLIPYAVAFSPDGSRAYVANNQAGTVTVIDTAAQNALATITVGAFPNELAVSPDGSTLYVDNSNMLKNPSTGSVSVVSTATNSVTATITVGLLPDGLALTADGSQIYVANTDSGTVSVISTASKTVTQTIPVGSFPHGRSAFIGPAATPLAASILPGGRSVQLGSPATVFATILNTAARAVEGCRVALPDTAPAGLSLSYQTTNPATNAPTGSPDTPATIAGNDGYQTFVLSFNATAALSVTAQPLDFECAGYLPAPATIGVNTIDLTVSSTPVPDIVALAATATNDGTVHVPVGGAGAFAVATVNLGASANLTVSADTGAASLPISLSLCQTNPATGQCLAPPTSTVAYTATANGTPTFSIFVNDNGPIAFAPGTARIFVRFKDAAGASHGSTSVAVESP